MEIVVNENQSDLHQEFWKTLELLVTRDSKRTEKDVMDAVEEWVEKVIARKNFEDVDECLNCSNSQLESSSSGYGSQDDTNTDDFFKHSRILKIECKFSHPYVRSRLEKLMGSNMVSLTDREYMQRLQQRILEDYENEMGKRIAAREAQERERVKILVLTGIIPLDEAPPEMANHPVKLIDLYCQKLIAERRAKIKKPRIRVPRHLYWDDTPDPPSGLSIEKGHIFRKSDDRLCHHPDNFIVATREEDIENGYMFTDDDFMKLFYENPLIKQLQECMTVEEMYELADQIIGTLAIIDETVAVTPDASTA